MKELMQKRMQDLTVGESLKLTAAITGVAILVTPLTVLAAFAVEGIKDRIDENRRKKEEEEYSNRADPPTQHRTRRANRRRW